MKWFKYTEEKNMTVKELREKLAKYPENEEVFGSVDIYETIFLSTKSLSKENNKLIIEL